MRLWPSPSGAWLAPSFLLLLALLLLSHRKAALARRRKCPESLSEHNIIRRLFHNYTKMLPESEEQDESVHVNIEMHVQDMSTLNEISADFEIDILFTQLWHDPSLSFHDWSSECVKNITMESRLLKDIWTPNTVLINSKKTSVHASPTDNIMFILYENGTVWINHRLSVKAPCNLDLRTFPFDTQTCMLLFESYSHNSEEVTLHWMAEPITLMKQISLPDFDMVQFDTKRETLLYPNGYWDELQASFTFKRRYGFYILQAYVPTYLTIIVSWVGFCMEPKALPARTTVGVSSLLALTLQFGNIHKNLPRVSYVKAMDVWMLGCISFVFGTMIELAVVCFITRCQNSRAAAARRRRSSSLLNLSSASVFPPAPSLHQGPFSARSLSALFCPPPESSPSLLLETNLLGTFVAGRPSRAGSLRVRHQGGGGTPNGRIPHRQHLLEHRGTVASSAPATRKGTFGPFHFTRRRRKLTLEERGRGRDGEAGGRLFAEVNGTTGGGSGRATHLLGPEERRPNGEETNGRRANGALGSQPQPQAETEETQRARNSANWGTAGTGGGGGGGAIGWDQLSQAGGTFFAQQPQRSSSRMLARRRSSGEAEDTEENWPIIRPESIDKLSIVVFPLAFTLFNLVYWWYYLFSLGGQFDQRQQQEQQSATDQHQLTN